MSVDAILWAVKQLPTGLTKLVLIALSDFADNDEYECYPSIDQLSMWCGVSKSCIYRAIKSLENASLIARKPGAGQGHSNYKVGVLGDHDLSKWLKCMRSGVSQPPQWCHTDTTTDQVISSSGVSQPPLTLSIRPAVVSHSENGGGCETPLYNQSVNQSFKKNKTKKELDKNRSDEKSISDILPMAKSRSKPGQIAVDDARKLLTSSQPSGTLKTSLDERLMQAGHEFKNNEKNEEIEHNSNNGKTHKKNEVENLKPWEM